MALLEVRGLVKRYGPRKVVDGVSFEVNPGEVVGLLGPNGAGKTTSFRMATGQVVPNDGTVWFDGEDVTHLPMFRRARLGMGYLSQEPSIFRKLTVERNLLAILEALPRSRTLGRKLTRQERWERADEALARFKLDQVRKNPAARCSGGEKRRLEIARCLVCEPLLILLDEPLAAVDPLTKEDIRHNVRALANQGIGILLTDHDVREVLKIADRAYVIIDGQVVAAGTPEELKRNKRAVEGYLGGTFADEVTFEQLRGELSRQYPPPADPPPAPILYQLPNTDPDDDTDPPPDPNGGMPLVPRLRSRTSSRGWSRWSCRRCPRRGFRSCPRCRWTTGRGRGSSASSLSRFSTRKRPAGCSNGSATRRPGPRRGRNWPSGGRTRSRCYSKGWSGGRPASGTWRSGCWSRSRASR